MVKLTLDNTEVLVALMPDAADFAIAQEQHWYRIPVVHADKLVRPRWPPAIVAFLFSSKFGTEANCITHYARVRDIERASHSELFPAKQHTKPSNKQYYKLLLSPLEVLPNLIAGKRWARYAVFIPTTSAKLFTAKTIDDLHDASPLEDLLAAQMEIAAIPVRRQHILVINGREYSLDFSVSCENGKIDIETDGDSWHQAGRIEVDNIRNNDLASMGWVVLRFNQKQIIDSLDSYCIPTIRDTIKYWGGLKVKAL